ncbi:MAG: rhomboid family intramembrane serine protease [Candidatus Latescibacteria bacterium]|jgi:membrane associated rhomboid family serine protease|nr:rhomboid family intramembrane serine protease [Candidatus Latescibacterota bacterium]
MLLPIQDENPTYSKPVITVALLSANVMVFVYQMILGPAGEQLFIFGTAVIPYELTHYVDRTTFAIPSTRYAYPAALLPFPLTLFSAMFTHGGFMHLGGNMLYLWIFGNNIEDAMGHGRFFIFYMVTGLGATMVHVLSDPNSTIPMIGASGAIAGILGAYFVLYPKAKIKTFVVLIIFIQIIYVPAVFILGFWFLRQIIGIGSDDIAWYAHIGGFLVGMFLVRRFERPRRIIIDPRGEW